LTLTNEMVRGMSTAEKFSAIDLIWSTILPSEADDMEVPVRHLRMLERRLDRLHSGCGRVLPMDEAFAAGLPIAVLRDGNRKSG